VANNIESRTLVSWTALKQMNHTTNTLRTKTGVLESLRRLSAVTMDLKTEKGLGMFAGRNLQGTCPSTQRIMAFGSSKVGTGLGQRANQRAQEGGRSRRPGAYVVT
jgi:hypothetical protein